MDTFNKEHLNIEAWPPVPTHGMLTGHVPKGVQITHLPSGLMATCDLHRNQHQNRAAALQSLKEKVGRLNDALEQQNNDCP